MTCRTRRDKLAITAGRSRAYGVNNVNFDPKGLPLWICLPSPSDEYPSSEDDWYIESLAESMYYSSEVGAKQKGKPIDGISAITGHPTSFEMAQEHAAAMNLALASGREA